MRGSACPVREDGLADSRQVPNPRGSVDPLRASVGDPRPDGRRPVDQGGWERGRPSRGQVTAGEGGLMPSAVPGVRVLFSYRRGWLPRDLVAGLVLTALLVPQGMAYAELAGLPAITGLYTSILCLVGYAVFGPSRVLVLGPDSSLGPMIAATILPLVSRAPTPRWIIVAAEPITDVDTTAADMLTDLDEGLNAGGTSLVSAEVKDPVRRKIERYQLCLLYTSPSPRDGLLSRMPSSA